MVENWYFTRLEMHNVVRLNVLRAMTRHIDFEARFNKSPNLGFSPRRVAGAI